jgi:hypothetical protein
MLLAGRRAADRNTMMINESDGRVSLPIALVTTSINQPIQANNLRSTRPVLRDCIRTQALLAEILIHG